MNLSDLGADVIKVEPPGGEQTRRSGAVVPNEGKAFQALNRGKRGLVINLQDPRGRTLIHRMMPSIDVVAINYRLGVAERLGIDYGTLSAIRPDLIYWQNTGFGSSGPEARRAGSDIVAQGYSGLMVTDAKTNDDGAPDLVATPIADIASGFAAAMGICAALYHRALTGEGQELETSLLRTSLFLQGSTVMREPTSDTVLRDPLMEEVAAIRAQGGSYDQILEARKRRAALRAAFRLYYGAYRAKDGAVVLGALTKANRDAMRRVLGGEAEHSDEPEYDAFDPESQEQAAVWQAHYRALFLTRTAAEWVTLLDAAGVPVAPVHLPEELADDPQVAADGMMTELHHTVTGAQRVVGPAVTLTRTPTVARRAAPALGEHSAEVLCESGFDPAEVAGLVAAGVVIQR